MKYLILVLFLLQGCAATASSTATGLPNLHQVDSTLYRGGQPDAKGYAYLQKLGIKTVLKLNSDQSKEERVLAKASGITLLEVDLSGLLAPSEEQEHLVQNFLADSKWRPTYVHCEHGSDRTGLAVALYRVHAMYWTPQAAHQEMLDYGHSKLLFGMDDFFYAHTNSKPESFTPMKIPPRETREQSAGGE